MKCLNRIDNVRVVFAIIACFMYLIFLGALLFREIPEINNSTVYQIGGSLQTILAMIFTYYFGSSEGSSRKTDMMNKQIVEQSDTITRNHKEQLSQARQKSEEESDRFYLKIDKGE